MDVGGVRTLYSTYDVALWILNLAMHAGVASPL